MVKHSHPLSVISGVKTSVPLVAVFLIIFVRNDTVMVGMTLVPVVHIKSELLVTIVQ